MSNPMAVTLDQFTAARSNFQAHYFLASCNTEFGGQEIQISWSTLADAVNNFISAHSLDESQVALRFVFCFDSGSSAMYLRLQILTMTQQVVNPLIYDLNSSPSIWYKITASGSMSTPTDTTTSDSAYLSAFYYCNGASCNSETVQQLSADTSIYAQNVVFPWQAEVKQLYTDNSSPTGASIVLAACSFAGVASDPVLFPHTLVIYLKNAAGDVLVDNSSTKTLNMKGADLGTLCPLMCGIYVSPI